MENTVISEVISLIEKIDAGDYENLYRLLKKAGKVFVAGAGRSGLIGRTFAMRLRHLGIESYAVGETICPPVRKGDLLLAISCSGNKKTLLELVKISRKAGAVSLCITSGKSDVLARLCNHKVIIPAGRSAQFGNSLFEQGAFLFLETFVEYYRRKKKITTAEMAKRHANLE